MLHNSRSSILVLGLGSRRRRGLMKSIGRGGGQEDLHCWKRDDAIGNERGPAEHEGYGHPP